MFPLRPLTHGVAFGCLLGMACCAQAAEKDELATSLRLLDQAQASLERARVAAAQSDPAAHGRYFFDYSRVTADINTIKAGIDHYLEPSRAQPREAGTVAGNFRRERP
ncbi:RAQPRD family integrative conjugative element protein [Serratia sp. JSRIV006]|uniref:integrative conjugative element protein, RAQPRD family n=1 Tax=Serratia sp. JSRIV006 TaxID=2831896 RepID=UPI00352FFA28|nr:RAQPRD family integrative conjugative element protein [Serratia sp. JSRIV006]